MCSPIFAILLCTYQGERFLSEQIDSFLSQTYGSWKVWASDDGSTDGTLGILDAYREKLGHERLAVVHGPERGFVANFLSLVCCNDIQADTCKKELEKEQFQVVVGGSSRATLFDGKSSSAAEVYPASNSALNRLMPDRTGVAEASPRAQKERPAMLEAMDSSFSTSPGRPRPASRRSMIWRIQ